MRVLVYLTAVLFSMPAMALQDEVSPVEGEPAAEEPSQPAEEPAAEEPPAEEPPAEEPPAEEQEPPAEEPPAEEESSAEDAQPAAAEPTVGQELLNEEEEEEEEDLFAPASETEPTVTTETDETSAAGPTSERDLRGLAEGLNAHEMPESAHTVGAGNGQIHLGLGKSSVGLSDNLDLRTRIVGQFFGFNANLKWAVIQDETKAVSIEPGVWAEWPWAKMGHPSYSLGTMLRSSQRVGNKGRLHLGLGAYYDVLKVTLQFSDDFVAGHGFGGDWYYSLTMARAPLVFAHDVEDISDGPTNPGWVFRGVRMPVVVGYEYLASQRSSFNTVLRFHPINFENGGSWFAELHPTYVTRMGKNTRIALGVNLVMPGNPLPIADEALTKRVEKEESNLHIRGWEDWFPALPVAPLPYVGVYWVF